MELIVGQKIFKEKGGLSFRSDERDIAVPYSMRQAVYEWCGANKITVEYQGTLGGTDVWRVRDEQQRAWFTMRWL